MIFLLHNNPKCTLWKRKLHITECIYKKYLKANLYPKFEAILKRISLRILCIVLQKPTNQHLCIFYFFPSPLPMCYTISSIFPSCIFSPKYRANWRPNTKLYISKKLKIKQKHLKEQRIHTKISYNNASKKIWTTNSINLSSLWKI